jgi:hypothetical protein
MEIGVATQEILEGLDHVHLGCGHDLCLVVQRPLPDREPDGDEIFFVSPQPQIPAAEILLAIDGDQRFGLGQPGGGPSSDQRVARIALTGTGDVGDGQGAIPSDPTPAHQEGSGLSDTPPGARP